MPKAPRQCPTPGCTNLIRHTRHCPEHTVAWAGPRTTSSTITGTTRWQKLRRTILERDHYACQIQTPDICIGHASQVDKIRAAAQGGDPYAPANLRAACKPCNQHKARTTDRH